MTKIDSEQVCAACGLPRHAHWGRNPLAAGRCAGFKTDLPQTHREEIDTIISATLVKVSSEPDARLRAVEYEAALTRIRKIIRG